MKSLHYIYFFDQIFQKKTDSVLTPHCLFFYTPLCKSRIYIIEDLRIITLDKF